MALTTAERSARYVATHREQVRAQARIYVRARAEHFYANRIQRDFGLTIEQYNAMLAAQGGTCAICHQVETASYQGTILRLAVDHDPDTGMVRGLLCRLHNQGIGQFAHDPDMLREAAAYLERSTPRA